MNRSMIENLSCYGRARLIVERIKSAEIFEVETLIPGEEPVSHAYVLYGDMVLNNDCENLSKSEVLKRGKNVTSKILSTPWEKL